MTTPLKKRLQIRCKTHVFQFLCDIMSKKSLAKTVLGPNSHELGPRGRGWGLGKRNWKEILGHVLQRQVG